MLNISNVLKFTSSKSFKKEYQYTDIKNFKGVNLNKPNYKLMIVFSEFIFKLYYDFII